MSTGVIEEVAAAGDATAAPVGVIEMTRPETAGHAEMLAGDPKEVADLIAGLLAERGLL